MAVARLQPVSLACRLLLLRRQSTQLLTVSLQDSQERIWWAHLGSRVRWSNRPCSQVSMEQVEIETLLFPLYLASEMLELGVDGVAGVYVIWTVGETLLG